MTCIWLFALAAAAAEPVPAPPSLGLDALLGKPVSPGVVALLLPHLGDERASARVIESLAHENAAVRAAAARVANVGDIRGSLPAVRRALDAETDRAAALEQLRAAVLLGSGKDDANLIPLAVKHDLVKGFAETLAVARGPAALPLLDALRTAGLSEDAEPAVVAVATRRGREGLSIVATSALRTRNAPAWAHVLSLARQPGAVLSPGLPVAALGSKAPALRVATYWHLALTHDKSEALSPELEAALAATPEATGAGAAEDVDAAFAFAVLARARTGAKKEDWGARAASGDPFIPVTAEGRLEPIAGLLTKAEAKALSRKLTEGRNDDIFVHARPRPKPRREEPEGERYGAVSYAGGLPPGMLRDILAIGGCAPGPHLRAIGLVTYARDGRPRRVAIGSGSAPTACPDVAGPLLGLTLLPPPLLENAEAAPPDERRIALVVPLDEGSIACAEPPDWSSPARVPEQDGAPGKIKEPRKVHNLPPVYPARAKEERRQGAVVIEAIISATGCIRSTRLISGREPDLNAAALAAISQWRYTPTLLDGKPVPVFMRVTVNFRLR